MRSESEVRERLSALTNLAEEHKSLGQYVSWATALNNAEALRWVLGEPQEKSE